HGQVTVAGVEPRGLAQLSHGLRAEECVALHAPSALAAEHAGKHISDRIDVGRDVEAPPEKVVAGVHNERDVFGGHDLAEAVDELRTAGSAAEDADHRVGSIKQPSSFLILARPRSSAAARSFSDSKPGLAVTAGINSGYTGRRCCNVNPLASVRRRSCSRCGQGFSGLMKSGVNGD